LLPAGGSLGADSTASSGGGLMFEYQGGNEMEKYIKNIAHESVLSLADEVQCLPGQVVSKTLAQNSYVSMTLFAFDANEEISAHASRGDAMVTALFGTGKVTIADQEYTLNAGETIVMPANIPHAIFALEAFKMVLTVIFPSA
jgi:quercetin dioxygenase-like cupin family protein